MTQLPQLRVNGQEDNRQTEKWREDIYGISFLLHFSRKSWVYEDILKFSKNFEQKVLNFRIDFLVNRWWFLEDFDPV